MAYNASPKALETMLEPATNKYEMAAASLKSAVDRAFDRLATNLHSALQPTLQAITE